MLANEISGDRLHRFVNQKVEFETTDRRTVAADAQRAAGRPSAFIRCETRYVFLRILRP